MWPVSPAATPTPPPPPPIPASPAGHRPLSSSCHAPASSHTRRRGAGGCGASHIMQLSLIRGPPTSTSPHSARRMKWHTGTGRGPTSDRASAASCLMASERGLLGPSPRNRPPAGRHASMTPVMSLESGPAHGHRPHSSSATLSPLLRASATRQRWPVSIALPAPGSSHQAASRS